MKAQGISQGVKNQQPVVLARAAECSEAIALEFQKAGTNLRFRSGFISTDSKTIMQKPSISPARAVLLSFMKEMNAWEIQCVKRQPLIENEELDYVEVKTMGMSEYMEIFKKYCSSKAIPRNYSFTKPPEYDPTSEKLLSEENLNSKAVEIHTQAKDVFSSKYLYKITLVDGEWKIQGKKRFDVSKNKFMEYRL